MIREYLRDLLLSSFHALTSVPQLLVSVSSGDSVCFLDLAASCSRLPAIRRKSSSLSLAQFSLAEAINCSHLLSTYSQFINVSFELLQFIRWLSVHRHSTLGTLLDRVNLTPILDVTGVCGYRHIRNAEEAFPEYMAHFEAVEMLHPSLSQ